MDLFDKYIVNTADLLGGYPSERFAFSKNKIWETSAHAEFMTQKESQTELGGGNTPSRWGLPFRRPTSTLKTKRGSSGVTLKNFRATFLLSKSFS